MDERNNTEKLKDNLKNTTDLQLLSELIRRNGVDTASAVTRRSGDWTESIIGVGVDNVAYITMTDESLEKILDN